MNKITKANYKAPLYPIGDKFTMTPARVGHLNQVIDEVTNKISSPANITQLTDNQTAVTLNANSGVITMAAPTAASSNISFTVNNDKVTSSSAILLTTQFAHLEDGNDTILVSTLDVTDGSFKIVVRSTGSTSTPTSGVLKIHFLVIG